MLACAATDEISVIDTHVCQRNPRVDISHGEAECCAGICGLQSENAQ